MVDLGKQNHPMSDWSATFRNRDPDGPNQVSTADVMMFQSLGQIGDAYGLRLEFDVNIARHPSRISDWNINVSVSSEGVQDKEAVIRRVNQEIVNLLREIEEKIRVVVEVTVTGDIIPPEFS